MDRRHSPWRMQPTCRVECMYRSPLGDESLSRQLCGPVLARCKPKVTPTHSYPPVHVCAMTTEATNQKGKRDWIPETSDHDNESLCWKQPGTGCYRSCCRLGSHDVGFHWYDAPNGSIFQDGHCEKSFLSIASFSSIHYPFDRDENGRQQSSNTTDSN